MTKKFQKNESGITHVLLVVLIIVVGAVIGLVAAKVINNSSKSSVSINKATQDKCLTAINDKQFCKFAGVFANATNYRVSLNATDPSAGSVIYELAYDSNNNISMVVKQNGQELGNVVVYGGVTYSKDYTDGKWFKYAAGDKNAPQALDLKKEFLKSDFKNDSGQKLTYKNLGTEKCGELTCYKYQETDPQKTTETTYLLFDTKDYLLRSININDSKDKTSSKTTITYGSVVIALPSPTKDAPAATAQ